MTLQIFVRNPTKYDDEKKFDELVKKVQDKFS